MKGIPRGFYKWSEDEHTGVVQGTWVDRKPVQLLSTAHGAFHSGVLRLTSQGGDGLPGMQRKLMGAPYLARRYNEEMGNVDTHDFKALQEHFSWERRSRSRKMGVHCIQGYLRPNASELLRCFAHRNMGVDASYNHEQIYYRLTVQWYNCFYAQILKHLTEMRLLGTIAAPYNYQTLRPPPVWASMAKRQRFPPAVMPRSPPVKGLDPAVVHLAYRRNLKRSGALNKPLQRQYFYCCITDNFALSEYQRNDRTGTYQKNASKSTLGCILCNVVLCVKGNCWRKYHKHHQGENDGMDPTLFDN
jgi:hypothetical protein